MSNKEELVDELKALNLHHNQRLKIMEKAVKGVVPHEEACVKLFNCPVHQWMENRKPLLNKIYGSENIKALEAYHVKWHEQSDKVCEMLSSKSGESGGLLGNMFSKKTEISEGELDKAMSYMIVLKELTDTIDSNFKRMIKRANAIQNDMFQEKRSTVYDLKDKLVIALSSRALFDLEKENRIFDEEGPEAYYDYQLKNEETPLEVGTAFQFVKNLLAINKSFDDKLIEVIILSHNNAATGLRIGRSIEHYQLEIEWSGWTSGTSVARYMDAFKVDLFLSAHPEDIQDAINANVAVATILPYKPRTDIESDMVKIAFDGDAVIFGDESEKIYQERGLEAFLAHERENAKNPLSKGPFFKFLKVISDIQNRFPMEKSPIRTALVTTRSFSTHERVLRTLDAWGVRIDEAFFQGGVQKYEVIKTFGADIFFDDQDTHLQYTTQDTPSAKVPYRYQSLIDE